LKSVSSDVEDRAFSMDEDIRTVESVLKGDKEAFEMIMKKYQTPLLNYIGRMINNRQQALDFTQEIFIKSYASLHTYQPKYKFSTWLFKIASNTLIDHWRKKKLDTFSVDQNEDETRYPSFQIPDNEKPVAQQYELSQLRIRIEEALKKIPPALKELFVWRHVNEFSYEEIAEIKGLPIGTIKNRVFQAKELIRKQMECEI